MKPNKAQLSNEILSILAKNRGGLLLAEILQYLNNPPLKRTLQRRLSDLRKQGQIITEGQGRLTRYHLSLNKEQKIGSNEYGQIPISKQSSAIKEIIAKPIKERIQVNYQKNFLYDYVPNETYYLNANVRNHLHQIGKQPDGDQPAATFAKHILNRLMIDLSWNSSRLEGNTYSLLETERLIDLGQKAQGKDLFETRMILNHKDSIEFLIDLGEDLEFNRYIILNLHAMLARNLLGDPNAAGRLRTIPVGIGRTVYQPVVIPQLIEQYFQQIIDTLQAIKDPFEQSFFAFVHFPYLQPFIDVNKRVSRLASNIPLIKHNYCPISYIDLPKKAYIDGILGVYELNKVELLADVYLWAYDRSTLRYNEARGHLREPDVFKERYDQLIIETIREIILNKRSKEASVLIIENTANINLPKQDVPKFIEVVETNLLSLHEGNIAAYKVKPHQFIAWQHVWMRA